MSTTINPTLTQAEQIFKDLLWDPMVTAGEVWIEGVVPVLALPGVEQIDEAIIQAASDAIFNQIILFIDVESIQLINTAHQTVYDNASLQLKIIAEEKGTISLEYQEALTAALIALSQFTDINQ